MLLILYRVIKRRQSRSWIIAEGEIDFESKELKSAAQLTAAFWAFPMELQRPAMPAMHCGVQDSITPSSPAPCDEQCATKAVNNLLTDTDLPMTASCRWLSLQAGFIHMKVITDTFWGTAAFITVWRRQVLIRIRFYYLKNIAC